MIVAIDPGPTESAWVVWREGGPREHGHEPNDLVLDRMYYWTHDLRIDRAVIEMIGHYGQGMPAGKEVFNTCVWIGRFMEAFGADRVDLILRATIKAHLCGSTRAKDANVRQALLDRFGGREAAIGKKAKPGPLFGFSGDQWSALAVAVAHVNGCALVNT